MVHPMTARACLILKLSQEKLGWKEKLRGYENKLPLGRCLTGFEILMMFRMTGWTVPDEQSSEIEQLYQRWERDILWKANNMESNRHEKLCAGIVKPGEWCKCRTRQEEIHEWEDWILDNYDLADTERRWTIPVQVLARVAPPKPASYRKDSE